MSLKKALVVCYDESCNVKEVIDKLMLKGNLIACAYIKHNLDIDDNGNLKKTHYHVYLQFNNPTTKKQVANFFNVHETLVQSALNPCGIIRYFLHLDSPNKTPYKKSNIVAFGLDIDNLLSRSSIGTQDETLILRDILNKVYEGYNLRELLEYVLINNYYYVYRANYQIIRDMARVI